MKVVVTAGATREPLDPVRFLSNRSSGKMGYAIAEAALEDGHEVTLISGPVRLTSPSGAKLILIITSDELFAAVRNAIPNCDLLVMCAAVADYKPAEVAARKMEKRAGKFSLELIPTRDILASLPNERSCFVVGFAAQTHELEKRARDKLLAKNCDMIVANDVGRSDIGMESAENEVVIFFRNGDSERIERAPKKVIARELMKIIFRAREKSLTKKT